MSSALSSFQHSKEGQEWSEYRQGLPVAEIKEAILSTIAQDDVLVVMGSTGCGKTTQVNPGNVPTATIGARNVHFAKLLRKYLCHVC